MERVIFLIEDTNERLPCLLNPETVSIWRTAGVQSRQSIGGQLTHNGYSDDSLLYTGGGRTEMQLDLLFDVSLADSTMTTSDVRVLTRPLWNLTENQTTPHGYGTLRRVRFLWGKHWDIPAVVVAVAERLEQFTVDGAPRRSWLRLHLLRVADTIGPQQSETTISDGAQNSLGALPFDIDTFHEEWDVYETFGNGADGAGERIDQLATDYYGDPSLWRLIAKANGIDDPLQIPSGTALQIPPLSILTQQTTP